jgi:predicted MFS family arabinose efflux permease
LSRVIDSLVEVRDVRHPCGLHGGSSSTAPAPGLITTILFYVTIDVGISPLVSVLMRQYMPLRGPVMGLNSTGQNVGLVAGTGLATVALSMGGYVGLAVTLLVISLVALGCLLVARRSPATASPTV